MNLVAVYFLRISDTRIRIYREDWDLHYFHDNSKFPENGSHSGKRETGHRFEIKRRFSISNRTFFRKYILAAPSMAEMRTTHMILIKYLDAPLWKTPGSGMVILGQRVMNYNVLRVHERTPK